MIAIYSEYDPTESVYVNSYPWLFPGGIGDLYGVERGKWGVEEWGATPTPLLRRKVCQGSNIFFVRFQQY